MFIPVACFRILQTLGKHFLHPAACGSTFPAQNCWAAWRCGGRILRGQANMANEAKLCSPIHSTVEVLVVQRAIGWCYGEDNRMGPFCWPVLAEALQFSVHLINLLSILLRYNGFTRIQKAVVDQMGSRPPDSDSDLLWCKFGFWKCFGASSWSRHWAGHHWLSYTIYFLSHVPIQKQFVFIV